MFPGLSLERCLDLAQIFVKNGDGSELADALEKYGIPRELAGALVHYVNDIARQQFHEALESRVGDIRYFPPLAPNPEIIAK